MGEKGGRFPRKIRVILTSAEDCKRVLQKSESARLANDVRLSRDKTFQERQEARLFWREKEEAQNDTTCTHYRIAGLSALRTGRSGEECVRIRGLHECQRYEQVHLERIVYELEDCRIASATNRYTWRGMCTN